MPGDGDVTIELHDQAPDNCGTLIYDGPLTFDSVSVRLVQVYVDHTGVVVVGG